MGNQENTWFLYFMIGNNKPTNQCYSGITQIANLVSYLKVNYYEAYSGVFASGWA